MNRIIAQANACNTLALAPPAFTVELLQATDLQNGRTCGKGFHMGDLANDFKVHSAKSQIMD
jgi:hypothetical protein